MTTNQILFSGCLIALLGAQAAAQDEQEQAECPDFVRGSTLKVRTLDRGVQLTIATPRPDSVRFLRAMTHNVAGYVESKAEETEQGLPALDITVADIAGGARVSIVAVNKADISVLRQAAKNLEQLWRFNACVNGGLIRA